MLQAATRERLQHPAPWCSWTVHFSSSWPYLESLHFKSSEKNIFDDSCSRGSAPSAAVDTQDSDLAGAPFFLQQEGLQTPASSGGLPTAAGGTQGRLATHILTAHPCSWAGTGGHSRPTSLHARPEQHSRPRSQNQLGSPSPSEYRLVPADSRGARALCACALGPGRLSLKSWWEGSVDSPVAPPTAL